MTENETNNKKHCILPHKPLLLKKTENLTGIDDFLHKTVKVENKSEILTGKPKTWKGIGKVGRKWEKA